MSPLQWLLCLVLVALMCFAKVEAEKDSGSGSNESGSGGKRKHNNAPIYQRNGYPYYNHPIYTPQDLQALCGGVNPSPLPFYQGYAPPPHPPQQPMQPAYNVYPYDGYHNQPPQQLGLPQGPSRFAQGHQYFSGTPVGSSNIFHSLKVNKEYKEDGHQYKSDVH